MEFGVSYYPELIPADQWERDLDLMAEHGLTVVRFLEFAWSRFEPREGEYEWPWLDRFLAMLTDRKMTAILGTPTASAPPWFSRQHPEAGCVMSDGERLGYGSRRTLCVNHPVYRHFAEDVARRLGERYGEHPAVIGWQIDNELIGPERGEFLCHCENCQWRFRDWLKRRYPGVDAVNEAWGLGFWSMSFGDWGEVVTPRRTHCPGYVLDAYRFYSDSQVAFIKLQRDALRQNIDDRQFICHNSTGIFDRGIDHRAYARAQDQTGWDAYAGAAAAGHEAKAPFAGLAHDLFRSSLGKPFWVFETNTDERQYAAYLAEMRARGARGIVYWHWRQHRSGVEQNNPALCDHAGRPNLERLAMLRRVHERLRGDRLPESIDRRPAAIVFTPDCVRAVHRRKQRPIPYLDAVAKAYQPLWRHGIATDVVYPGQALDGYRLVVMPGLSLISAEQAAVLRTFVEHGGVLLAGGETAHRDLHGVFFPRRGQPLEEVLGFSIESSGPDEPAAIETVDGRSFPAAACVESVAPTDAEVLAWHRRDGERVEPAALRHRFGEGTVFYAASRSGPLHEWLAEAAADAAGLDWHATPHAAMAIQPHLAGDGFWLINHSDRDWPLADRTIPAGEFAFVEEAPAADKHTGATEARSPEESATTR